MKFETFIHIKIVVTILIGLSLASCAHKPSASEIISDGFRLASEEKYDEAQLKGLQAEELLNEDSPLTDRESLARLYGLIYYQQNIKEKAKDSLAEALKLAVALNDTSLMEINLFNLGLCATTEKEAVANFRRAASLSHKSGNKLLQSSALEKLAQVYISSNKYEEAQQSLDEATALCEDDSPQQGEIAMTQCRLWLAEGKYDAAEQGYKSMESLNVYGRLAKVNGIYDILVQKGDCKRALAYKDSIYLYTDSIKKLDGSRQVEEIEKTYHANIERKNQRFKTLLWVSLSVLAVILIILFFVLKTLRLKKRQVELDDKISALNARIVELMPGNDNDVEQKEPTEDNIISISRLIEQKYELSFEVFKTLPQYEIQRKLNLIRDISPEHKGVIRTKKLNEGFHAVAAGNVSVSEEWSGSGEVSLNYHTESGWTVFGDFSYGFSGFKQNRHYSEVFFSENIPNSEYHTETYAKARSRSQSFMADGGLNYDFGKHSVGIKYTFNRTPKSRYTGNAESTTDYRQTEEVIASLSNLYRLHSKHHINTFGSFVLPGDIGLRIDADYVGSLNNSNSSVDENESENTVVNSNFSNGHLWSGKLVLSRTYNNVEMEIGTDVSYTHNIQNYFGSSTGNQGFINPETDDVKQNLYAAFGSFDWSPNKKWNLYGGLRLESTETDFRQNGINREDLSRSYTDWLPNFGISFNSPVKMTLYYRASLSRPGYQSLDNTYVYVTPTLWETGNSELRSTLRHKVGLNLYYKKFVLQGSFTRSNRSIAYIYKHDSNDCINLTQPINLPDYNALQIVAIQRLDFGFWHPTLQGVFYVQDLKYGTPKRKYNKPLYTLSMNNRFDIPGGFYGYFNIFGLGTGNQVVIYSRGSWQASLTLNKSWKNWTFTLSANDIFNTWRQRFDTITNTVDYSSDIKGASRSISLSIRYTLNAAKGKYKGKVSRQDEIDRLN